MEYLIGSLATFILVNMMSKRMIKDKELKVKQTFVYRQSHIFDLVKPLLPPLNTLKPERKSQSMNHENKTNVKVIIMGSQAFWIKDNMFYMADMDGQHIDKESTRRVDTMAMDRVELDKMLFIMDQLRDRNTDDSGSSGN
jgi:hypothetical protein